MCLRISILLSMKGTFYSVLVSNRIQYFTLLFSEEAPVPQGVVHLARSQRVMALTYFWNSEFFPQFSVDAISSIM